MNSTKDILKGRDFVIVSSIDWTEIHQMPQQLANSLVDCGHRVLFIENTGVRAPRLGDVARISARIRNWLKGTRGFSSVHDNLTVYSPLFIPLPYSRLVLAVNRLLLSTTIGRWMRSTRFHSPIVVTFLPTPLSDSIINEMDPVVTIYYCVNDMAGGSSGAAALRPYEDIFFAKADAVFCTANALMDGAKKFAKQVHLLPAGVDYAKFENARINDEVPADLLLIQKPIVGYIGAISGVFDQELMVEAALALPMLSFVLIGPIYTDVSALEAIPNIKLLGMRSHDEVPAYIKGFDVALIPYIKNNFTETVYSCKLNEYLAMGASVVTTNLKEIRSFVAQNGNVLLVAETSGEFVEMILQSLERAKEDSISLRIAVARANSWESRFESIYGIIEQLVESKRLRKLDWKERLNSQYRIARSKIISLTLVLLISYVSVFYTPLTWFAGDILAIKNAPKVSDAIVVFSGDGESSYINQSYQRRTIDAIKYFNAGYAPLIIISSGKDQSFSEVEIIRALLTNRGVPEQSIKIVDKYPRSTLENVLFVKDILDEKKIKSIMLITAPYHSRRALLVWQKAMPDLEVLAPMVIDTPSSEPQWQASFDQIKIICYEYAAITYYWVKGWL